MHRLDLGHLSLTLGFTGAIFYALCVLWGYLRPSDLHNQLFTYALPGTTWLTAGSFVLGLVEVVVYAVVVALVFGGLWNAFLKKQ